MDAYETPSAEFTDDNNRPFKPVKGIFVGLAYTIVLATIVSVVLLLALGTVLGFDLTSPALEIDMANSPIYLISDLIVTAIILFLGGRATGKRTPGSELKFGLILAAITIVIYLLLMISTDSFDTYPIFYTLATFAITAAVIPYGSISTRKT